MTLVERLREYVGKYYNWEVVWRDMTEAADRIEQLEAALRQIANTGLYDCRGIAKARLEGVIHDARRALEER